MNRSESKTRRSRFAPWARLALYCALVALAAFLLTLRSVAAAAGERGLMFGRQLGSFQIFAGRSTDVVLNGQRLTLHTRVVQRPVRAVLDEFAKVCRGGSSRATAEFAEHVSSSTLEVAALQRLFVMRDQREDLEGTALCFSGFGEGSLSDITARFRRFADTLDLRELGALRYVYLRKNERGTHVIFVTSDGPLSLARLWPSDGRDVDGAEPIEAARPKDSVRFISARLLGATRGFTAYRSPQPAAESLHDYAEQVRTSGYEVLDFAAVGGGERSLGLDEGVDLRVLRKDGQTWVTTSVPDGSGSFLSVVSL